MSASASSDPPVTDTSTSLTSKEKKVPPRPAASAFAIPKDWVTEPYDESFVVSSLKADLKKVFVEKQNMLYGTTVTAVLSAFLKTLFTARKEENPSDLLADMVFSVFVSQTVSREWARIYPSLGRRTMFAPFEITGNRVADAKVPTGSWVNSSAMNGTAVGYLGHLIMATAKPTSSLGKKAKMNGTIFSPNDPKAEGAGEYTRICYETYLTLSDKDKAAPRIFANHAAHLVSAVEFILEGGETDLDEVLAALDSLPIKKF